MKKLYPLVTLLFICKILIAQDPLVMLTPLNLQGLNPALTDYGVLNWEAPSFISSIGLNKSMMADTVSTENLSGYNIYRDSVLIATVDATTLQYFDMEPVFLFPNEYHVSALYDLTDYGLPGETGESVWEGPVFITIVYCGCGLPFVEEFNTGLFLTNQWDAGGNWLIEGQEGNPAPCAKFSSIPIVTDYSQSLTSYWYNGDVSNSSEILLDFDLKLTDNSIDSTEKIYVDVYRSSVWTNVAVYKNSQSSEWIRKSINITDAAYGDYFKVRFRAEGINTTNFQNWLVDNIHVYIKDPLPTTVNEIDLESATIYPNPASSMITLSFGSGIKQVEIFNLLGNRLVNCRLKANEHQIPVDVATFKNGVYLVKFTSHSSKTNVKKLTVQR